MADIRKGNAHRTDILLGNGQLDETLTKMKRSFEKGKNDVVSWKDR